MKSTSPGRQLVLLYDGLVQRAEDAEAELAAVYSADEEWRPYGVEALPYVSFRDLPAHYRMYAAHLNAPNAIRDATANEKLFEIPRAAGFRSTSTAPMCAPAISLPKLFSSTRSPRSKPPRKEVLRDPDAALARGQKPRVRTMREHLWTTASPRCWKRALLLRSSRNELNSREGCSRPVGTTGCLRRSD